MTLQTSGPISFQQINVELGRVATAQISLNDAAVRQLLEKPSGAVSMQDAYGKSTEIRFVNTVARTSVSIYQLMGSPTAPDIYVFENNAEIAANTASYALRTGVFPAGSTLTIVNNGYIYGLGGAGSSAATTSGGAGGDAIYIDMACQIDNTSGYILAGGGGGGSTERKDEYGTYYIRAGGGGGAGSLLSAAGINNFSVYPGGEVGNNIAPQPGTDTAGGAGGAVGVIIGQPAMNDRAYGGAGGANGEPGAVGSTADLESATYKHAKIIGVAGAAGRAIISNGKSVTQIAGFNTTRVKGAIV